MKRLLNITISNHPTEIELFDDTPENRVALLNRAEFDYEILKNDSLYKIRMDSFINMKSRRMSFLISDDGVSFKTVHIFISTLDEELKSLEMHHKTACARLEAFYKNDVGGKRALTYSTFKEIY